LNQSVQPVATGRRIGLYGGSFDPVHCAHLALADSALDALALDELRWIPAGVPWQRPHLLAPAEHRLAMLELALADPQWADPRFLIDRCELERSGPSYTIDTVLQLQAAQPGQCWFLLIGQDQHARLHTWHRWRELLGRVKLAVAVRPGVRRTLDPEVLAAGHHALPMLPQDLSGTALRERIAAGEPIAGLVPVAVAGYIDSHRLYCPLV
jgi:nicotinate-nucleotide adenylyltransferase